MKNLDIDIINDGEELRDIEKYRELGILDYCKQYNKKATVGFVGVVIKKDRAVLSLPKKYELDKNINKKEKIKILKKILKIFSILNIKSEGNFDVDENEQFPIKSYLEIYGYYKRFGLYKSVEKYKENGCFGNVDWNRTFNLKGEILQKNGIIFDSFIITKNRDVDVFLGECMDYVLNDASNYSDILDIIRKYKAVYKNKIFNNIERVIKTLSSMTNKYFKDIEKRLIQNLINYFTWKSSSKGNFRLLTLNFELYWEAMVNIYLNEKFSGYNDGKLLLEGNNVFYFEKKVFEVGDYKIKINEGTIFSQKTYKIIIDHFCETDDTIFIFDSKYYNRNQDDLENLHLNYKQIFYGNHVKTLMERNDSNFNKEIINGLILPKYNYDSTLEEEMTYIHIDRTKIDETMISEHYLDLDDVIKICVKDG